MRHNPAASPAGGAAPPTSTQPSTPAPRASLVVAALGALAVVAYALLPTEDTKDVGYLVVGAAATVVMLAGYAVRRPGRRSGWLALAGANALFVLGDGVTSWYDLVLHRNAPTPSVADAVYLAGYPVLFLGVARVTRLRSTPGAREACADAAILSVGALALTWHLLMHSYARDGGLSVSGRLVTMAYPIMDVAVLFIVAGALAAGSARRACDVLLGAAVLVMLAADFTYDLLELHSAYVEGGPADIAFLANYVLVAAAAAHPSVGRAAGPPTRRRPGRLRLPLVAAAAFVPSGLVVACYALDVPVDAGVLAATSLVLTALAVLRATWFVRHLRRQSATLAERGESLARALAAEQALEQDLRHRTFHDPLTGLANRALLHERLADALDAAAARGTRVCLCVLDLDAFKAVNDGGGHLVGDEVLLAVGARLDALVGPGTTVARLGGDEFAILLADVDDADVVRALAERVVAVLREPITAGDREVAVSASLGVAFADADATVERLLAEAGAALAQAKSRGKDRVAFYDADMGSRLGDRILLTNAFRTALAAREFDLEFQPQVRLGDGALEGFEALVRWRHPGLGTVSPGRFVPLAEETGFVVPLGRWVLRQACLEAAGWTGAGTSCSVSVNVSGRQLQDPGFAADVRSALSDSGLPPHRLVLEVTETVLMTDPAATVAVLEELKTLGLRVAIDDFGTGYSSLSALRQFPADVLKIDKSFVDRLEDPTGEGRAVVRTILRLAEALALEATAEGVEHERQLRILHKLRCHTVQGFLFSAPLTGAATRDYIAAARGGPAVPVPV